LHPGSCLFVVVARYRAVEPVGVHGEGVDVDYADLQGDVCDTVQGPGSLEAY
jgi:hypothetical protein